MLNNPLVITNLITDILFGILLFVTLIIAIKIALFWDYQKSNTKQYKLEKSSYLASTIIKLVLYIKIPLFFYYLFTLDYLSNYIAGAMCGAGVVTATETGLNLLFIKVINIYLFALWIGLDKIDFATKDFKYTKSKFMAIIPIILLFFVEIYLGISNFATIEPDKIVSCCGTLFNASSNTIASDMLSIPNTILVPSLYLIYLLILVFKNHHKLSAILSLIFVPISILFVINFLSPYIYELPTHKCPFCILQSDYYYVGYGLYISLFIATFSGISNFIKSYLGVGVTTKQMIVAYCVFILICSYYPVAYFIKNGVWL